MMRTYRLTDMVIGLLSVFLLFACGNTSNSLPPATTGGGVSGGGASGGSVAATIAVSANPSTLSVGGTSSVSATVLDQSGGNVPDGTQVSFSLGGSTLRHN